ncbi:MAG: glycosyltransferase family 4 protein, partial [Armatimonadetes bacterium]|nr:glycosyltransferase family 4 protein [Armatimonadota bacterium]
MAVEPLREIIVTAAHGGVSSGAVPIGGGAAIVHALLRVWGQQAPCPITLLGLGDRLTLPGVAYEQVPVAWPPGRGPADLVRLKELPYARLCREFERQVTARILARPRPGLCVLANDLSEGPDFAALAAAGVPVVTLWHVDVVDYFCRFYLGGLDPARLAAWHRRLRASSWLPDVLRLVFSKQESCVRGSFCHVVPSSPMKTIIERCYPPAPRVEVVPWGGWDDRAEEAAVATELVDLRQRFQLADDEIVLLTLSRISPEKGIERLLEALAIGRRRGELPTSVRLLIAGEAAFMQGQRYRCRLERLAERLPCRVDFVGYAAGARKQALWRLADLYVFPSRHESYGLTLAEALRAGLPVVTTEHYSAHDLVPEGAGLIVA